MGKGVSIIIRTKNEERWVSACLNSVFNQEFRDFEVILIDNNSKDKTIDKAKQFEVKVLNVEEYLPGKAINLGIQASSGKYIVCLSGHCVPVNNKWLTNLMKDIELPDVAGVYGRQEPLSYSSDLDKRDLLVTFGLDKKIQVKDSFFHNANSIIKRAVWEQIPFDEKTTSIEDRIWGKRVLEHGYKIIYEPEASVYHYHGIYQDNDPDRARRVVEILEKLELNSSYDKTIDISNLKVVSIIPIKGEVNFLGGNSLLEYTLRRSLASEYISHTVVAADNPKTVELSKKLGADVALMRPPELSKDYIDIQEVLRYTIDKLEKISIIPDIVIYLSINYPFRPNHLIDTLITRLVERGYDSVLPAVREHRSCWIEEGGWMRRIDEGFVPSQFKNPVYIGISGLGTASHTDIIRSSERLGEKVGMVELDDIVYSLDVGKAPALKLAQSLIEEWWRNNN